MLINQTKKKLRNGETVFGCFLRYPDPNLVEVLGCEEWDFIVFDAEHGSMQPAHIENMVRAAELRNVTPLVRVTTNSQSVILRFMDTGALGLHVPWIESGTDTAAAVGSVKFHPIGRRGLAGSRAAAFGYNTDWPEYVKTANEQTLVVLQIESPLAVENLDEILKIEAVDVIFIGPLDLSNALGYPGAFDHPKFQDAVGHIADRVLKTDVALGIMVSTAEAAIQWQQRGARYLSTPFEIVLRGGCRAYLGHARSEQL